MPGNQFVVPHLSFGMHKMSLSTQFEQQLRTAGAGPTNLAAREGGEAVVCELAAVDSLGVSVLKLEYTSKSLSALSAEKLRDVADDLAKRVSYLLEAIAPIEIDDEACTIQMRSKPPHRAENATSYYEVLVTAGKISLKRYSKAKKAIREPEPFDLTRQVLCRVIDDFAAAAAAA